MADLQSFALRSIHPASSPPSPPRPRGEGGGAERPSPSFPYVMPWGVLHTPLTDPRGFSSLCSILSPMDAVIGEEIGFIAKTEMDGHRERWKGDLTSLEAYLFDEEQGGLAWDADAFDAFLNVCVGAQMDTCVIRTERGDPHKTQARRAKRRSGGRLRIGPWIGLRLWIGPWIGLRPWIGPWIGLRPWIGPWIGLFS